MKLRHALAGVAALVMAATGQAKTLNIPGSPSDTKLAIEVLHEVVKRSDRYDSITHIYGQAGDPAATKMMADLDTGL